MVLDEITSSKKVVRWCNFAIEWGSVLAAEEVVEIPNLAYIIIGEEEVRVSTVWDASAVLKTTSITINQGWS